MGNGGFDITEIQQRLDRWHAGDESAKIELLELAQRRFRSSAHYYLVDFPAIRRAAETNDVLQEFAMLFNVALEKVRPTEAKHFCCLAAQHFNWRRTDFARKSKGDEKQIGFDEIRRVKAGPGYSGEIKYDPSDSTHEPSKLAKWTELHEAVERLPPDLREVFDLHYYWELSHPVVAEQIGKSESTVKRRWELAKRFLAPFLEQLGNKRGSLIGVPLRN